MYQTNYFMENINGIPDVTISLVKMDKDLNEKISQKTGIPLEIVQTMMRYNVWTINQYSDIAGRSVATITNLTLRPILNRETGRISMALDYCYPQPNFGGKGGKCIFRNEKSMTYLHNCIS